MRFMVCVNRQERNSGSVTIKEAMIRFSTAGESHGEALIALVSGLPAGVPVDLEFVNRELWRRQQGYGRGGRMKIETDKAHVLSGVRHGKTIGSPIAIEIVNRDWKNWEEKLPVEAGDPALHQAVASPRPGHADLAGALKYNFPDARYVLERASARETTARVAAGAFAKLMLRTLGIEVASHVIRVGRVELERAAAWEEIAALAASDEVVLGCVDEATEARMKEEVEEAARTGDTVGGVFEVVVAWRARRPGHLRQLGRAAGRPARRGGDEHSGGQGGRDRPRHGGGRELRLRGSRSDSLRRRRRPASPRASPARRTMPAASRAASPTAKTLWCAAT